MLDIPLTLQRRVRSLRFVIFPHGMSARKQIESFQAATQLIPHAPKMNILFYIPVSYPWYLHLKQLGVDVVSE